MTTRRWLVPAVLACACTTTYTTDPDRSLPGPDGRRVMHINTETFAIHFALTLPFIGNAKLQRTHDRMTEAARAAGARNVEVVSSKISSYWYAVFPLTLLFTPVQTRVVANAEVPAGEDEPGPAEE